MSRSPVETADKELFKTDSPIHKTVLFATHNELQENRGSQEGLHPKWPFRETQTRFLRAALFTLGTMLQNEAVCPSVRPYVRIFGDFYEGDMDP